MDNSKILKGLERQRDILFQKLNSTSISELYKEQYAEIKSGKVFVFEDGKEQMLSDLKRLSKDTYLEVEFKNKLTEYLSLDNEELVEYFLDEFNKIFNEITLSGKMEEIQALFIEYDFYYHFTSGVICYGRQDYPLVDEPRYITSEFDYNKLTLFVDNGINFKPAWVDCSEFEDLDYLEINYELEELFKLHSRTLLNRALDRLNNQGKLSFLKVKPFMFYINEHDSEVMTLYTLN